MMIELHPVLAELEGKAIAKRMDTAESALAAFKLEMHRELQALKARLAQAMESHAEGLSPESGRRERSRLAWIEFAKGAMTQAPMDDSAENAAKAGAMLEQYCRVWEADNG